MLSRFSNEMQLRAKAGEGFKVTFEFCGLSEGRGCGPLVLFALATES